MRKVLFIDLTNKEYAVKTVTELHQYIGGVGIGFKLLVDYIKQDPVIFSIGPLNGFFPFASKTSVTFFSGGVAEDLYYGGSLSTRIRFTGLDSIVITGRASESIIIDIQDEEVFFRSDDIEIDALGLPGKRAIIRPLKGKLFLDDYFLTAEDMLEEKLFAKNVAGLVLTGTKTFTINNRENYEEVYNKVLSQIKQMTVEKSGNPSCAGCPMGCNKSRIGEMGGNVLVHSLVACTYAKEIYSNIGVVFSCLNVLGYDYTHEDIEALPALIDKIAQELL